MKKLVMMLGVVAMVFSVSCEQLLKPSGDSGPGEEYTYERCVELMLKMSGPNPDDGDRWDAEMACAPCQMGGYQVCKKLIDELSGAGK